ncbi:MAG: GNAT family N-acetyltransferase [Thermoplasmatales archaeon]|jgi:ribosomal protein S18 acetylase RimI-like enzyme|nr:GNAT family N-acetyltransferase [Candidatus Thermoplasmatota archaeon]MCL6003589.1 GNAT family N-acetyltransferase [Candidatus Thermoplasmatota archaeon]MDA8054766.1 GNAT family N-acetyltransferase [Thermoplasmatales archaeon]
MTKTTRMMTISELAVRRGSIKDIEEITNLENRAFGSHAYDYPSLRYMLGIANSVTTVATIEGRIVGYATVFFRKNSRISHLESIAVDPDFQGTGIGRVLMEEVDRVSIERNCTLIVLETFEKNVSALKLYERSGYMAKELVPDYYHIPYGGSRNAVRFEKRLQVK